VTEMPETRFTRVDGLDIAYQVAGPAAELDLVFVSGWVSHLEVMWELSEFARFLDRLAGMGRLITFDKRGTGLSDRVAGVPTLEQRADDILAVMDAAGSARAAILAWGEGAAIAAMFAATHPDRVAALVLGSLPIRVTGASRSGPACTPERWNTAARRPPAWRSMSARASPPWLSPARCWSPAPCRCWSSVRGSASPTAGGTASRVFPINGSCSRWSTPDRHAPAATTADQAGLPPAQECAWR
jgi:pimeloyl-ACP methyl ester carboxylesterase